MFIQLHALVYAMTAMTEKHPCTWLDETEWPLHPDMNLIVIDVTVGLPQLVSIVSTIRLSSVCFYMHRHI